MSCKVCNIRRQLVQFLVKVTFLKRLRKYSGISFDRRTAAKKVFEKLWVAGTLGAFFTGFYQAVARDFYPIFQAVVRDYRSHELAQLLSIGARDHLVRYWYFLWLLVYFFVSNFRNERENNPPVRDLVFDVIQSASALSAVVCLAFIGPNAGQARFGPRDYIPAVIGANLGIALICWSSLAIFGCDEGEAEYNKVRGCGLVLTLVLILVVSVVHDKTIALWTTLAQLFVMSAVLCRFLYLSLKTSHTP